MASPSVCSFSVGVEITSDGVGDDSKKGLSDGEEEAGKLGKEEEEAYVGETWTEVAVGCEDGPLKLTMGSAEGTP